MNLEKAIARNRARVAASRVAWLDMRREYLRKVLRDWFGSGWEKMPEAQREWENMVVAFGCADSDYPAQNLRRGCK